MITDIGLHADPTTCAFCGRKVQRHLPIQLGQCRAGLGAREEAANAAVKKEAEEAAKARTAQEYLDELDEQISTLEEKRKERILEVQKTEVFEKILSGEIDLTAEQEEDLHVDCHTTEEVEDLTAEAERLAAEEAWGYLQDFGGHTGACLSGALATFHGLHPLCTCGWNDVATRLERR